MDMKNNPIRRDKKDRRIATSSASFPLRDTQRILVPTDRRVSADRRTWLRSGFWAGCRKI